MFKLSYLAIALVAVTGSVQAQTWSRFISSGPFRTTTLASQGLAADGLGGVFVQSLETGELSGTDTSHIYALDGDGNDVYPWSVVVRPGGTDTAFTSRGLSASNGYRAAWFETGAAGQLQDRIWGFAPEQPAGSELQLDRLDGGRVLAASTDGDGGLLVVRDRSNGWSRPVLRRYAAVGSQWSLQWEQMLGSCYPGTVSMQQQDVDFDLDADPATSAVHLLGYCNGGIAGISTYYVQSFDLGGVLRAEQRFRPQMPGSLVARHRLGDGAWAYEFAEPNGGPRSLQVADVRFGLYPLNWNPATGVLRTDAVGDGVLMGARLTSDPTQYEVARVHRVNDAQFAVTAPRQYLWLSQFAAASTRWSADKYDRRVVAFRLETAGLPAEVALQAYGEGTAVEWYRSIDGATANGAIEMRFEPDSGEILIAVDRQDEDGSYGIQVERFWIRKPFWCPPRRYCIKPPIAPPV